MLMLFGKHCTPPYVMYVQRASAHAHIISGSVWVGVLLSGFGLAQDQCK